MIQNTLQKNTHILKILLFIPVLIFELIIGYEHFLPHWLSFAFSTILIILTTFIFYPKKWKLFLGLKASIKSLMIFFVFCLIFVISSHVLVKIALPKNIILKIGYPPDYIGTFFQCFAEELIFRGLLLTAFLNIGIKKWKIILYSAIFFSFIHWFSCYFLFKDKGILEIKSLLTITFFAVSVNHIFLSTRSILIPLALHFGWNSSRFASFFIDPQDPQRIFNECTTFNFLEGSNYILTTSITIMMISFLIFNRSTVNSKY